MQTNDKEKKDKRIRSSLKTFLRHVEIRLWLFVQRLITFYFPQKEEEKKDNIEEAAIIFRSHFEEYRKQRKDRDRDKIVYQLTDTGFSSKVYTVNRIRYIQDMIVKIQQSNDNRETFTLLHQVHIDVMSFFYENKKVWKQFEEIIPFEKKLFYYIWYNPLYPKEYQFSKPINDAVKFEIWVTYNDNVTLEQAQQRIFQIYMELLKEIYLRCDTVLDCPYFLKQRNYDTENSFSN